MVLQVVNLAPIYMLSVSGIETFHSTSLDIAFVIVTWYVVNCAEWCLHMLSHTRINLPFFKQLHAIHMQHHRVHYPINHLLKPGPYQDGGGLYVFGPLVLLMVCTAVFLLPFRYAFIFNFEGLLVLSTSTYLHDAYHVEGHWLSKYDWFLRRRSLHFYHHGHLKKNMSLSGIDSTMDKCMNTFVEVHVPKRGSKKHGFVPERIR